MKTRSLGSLNVSALRLGCMGMTYAYGPADEAEALRVLRCLQTISPCWTKSFHRARRLANAMRPT